MSKLSELSKPVGFVSDRASTQLKEGDPASIRPFFDVQGSNPLYSQEYVSALLTALRNLYAACDTGERRSDGSQQGVAMPDWGTVDSVLALLESINNG